MFRVWDAVLEALETEFTSERHRDSVVSAPSILGGIGAVAHRAMPSPPRARDVTPSDRDEVVKVRSDIGWDKKVTAGDKGGRRIRGHVTK